MLYIFSFLIEVSVHFYLLELPQLVFSPIDKALFPGQIFFFFFGLFSFLNLSTLLGYSSVPQVVDYDSFSKHCANVSESQQLGAQIETLLSLPLFLSPMPTDADRQNIGVDSHSCLQSIFLTQGWNLSLPHYRWILYHLNHHGSPTKLVMTPIKGIQALVAELTLKQNSEKGEEIKP